MIMAPIARDRGEEHLPAGAGKHGQQAGRLRHKPGLHSVSRHEHELQPLHSTGQGQGADDDDHQHDKQRGHTHVIELLNAAGNAAPVDKIAQGQKQRGKQHRSGRIGQHGGKQLPAGGQRFAAEGKVAEVQGHIFDTVTAQHRVKAHHRKGREQRQPADPPEFLRQGVIGAHGALSGLAAHGKLRGHDDKAHENCQQRIDRQIREAAGLAHFVGEAPDIAQANRRADGRHQEAQIAGPTGTFCLHKRFLSSSVCKTYYLYPLFFRPSRR